MKVPILTKTSFRQIFSRRSIQLTSAVLSLSAITVAYNNCSNSGLNTSTSQSKGGSIATAVDPNSGTHQTPTPGSIVNAIFKEDTTTAYNHNPERGFYYQPDPGSPCNGDQANLRSGSAYNQPVSLFRYQWNPATGTAQLAADLACTRANGAKLIIIPDYCNSSFCNEGVTMQNVKDQLLAAKSTFETYKDVIAVVQFGIVGAWGEGADSPNNFDSKTNRPILLQYLFDALPTETLVTAHQPAIVMQWYSGPLTESTAFSGSQQSRLGVADDSFMAGANDAYNIPGALTFTNGVTGDTSNVVTTTATQQRAWIATETEFSPFITETSDAQSPLRTGCYDVNLDNAGLSGGIMNEGPRYHMMSTHRDYLIDFPTAWGGLDANGKKGPGTCYNDVNNLMGYRFQYDSISHSDSVSRGGTLSLTLNMHNYGWSRIFLERRVNVTLINGSSANITCVSNDDLRRLPSQSTIPTATKIQCNIPSTAATGTYSVNLSMPDMHPAISKNRAYFIQPANANNGSQIWDDKNGLFSTGTSIKVN